MIRGTTPTITLTIKNADGLDLTQVMDIYVTLKQGQTEVTKTGEALEVAQKSVAFWLTQKESIRFKIGEAEVQINWTYIDNDGKKRAATVSKKIEIGKQLLERVV